jgi:hypothetical protein
MSPRWNWDSPTPLAVSECALPPPYQRVGGHTRLLLKGWGVPIPTTGKTLSTLPTLCIKPLLSVFLPSGKGKGHILFVYCCNVQISSTPHTKQLYPLLIFHLLVERSPLFRQDETSSGFPFFPSLYNQSCWRWGRGVLP